MSKIAFIGAGNMASAIVEGIIKSSVFAPAEIACTSAPDGSGERLAGKTGITYTGNLAELIPAVETGGYIVLAIKPQQLAQMPAEVADWAAGKTVISILAGTPLSKLCGVFNKSPYVVRVMPNTPGQIGAGVSCYAGNTTLPEAVGAQVEAILGALGCVFAVSEDKLDAVTAVSGSGPAYVFEFIAALEEAAEKVGLEKDLARALALQTVLGSAKLVEQTGEDPVALRIKVTSPNGTTQAALESMEADGFRPLVAKAVKAAADRSVELGKG
ncbi:MAG: pyrroline-5-carboxylate reductase [Opitutales bacterium]|nr:pyrroline-5-carboxylate reductase [Opitutales bacterium]